MMENRSFRWIAFAISTILAICALIIGTFSGFLCFAVAACIFIPIHTLFEKLDTEFDVKYRKRATIVTAGIFVLCGLLAFTTAGNNETAQDDAFTTTTTTMTTTEQTTTQTTTTTEETTTTTAATTTETTATTTEAVTTTVETTTLPVVEEPESIVEPEPAMLRFILNTDSNCLHIKPTCSNAQSILPENYSEIEISEDRLSDYSGQYWACGTCSKQYREQMPKWN